MSFVSGIAADVVEWLLGKVLRAVTDWLDTRAEQKQGAQAQASKETALAGQASADEAQAEAQVDRTQQGLVKAAQDGEF